MTFIRQIPTWMLAHKVWSGIGIIVILGAGYWGYTALQSSATETQYALGEVTEGTVVVALSESGQVVANQSLSLSPKSSGEVTYVGVKVGDKVSAGTVIVRVDDTDAEKTLRDAQSSLTSAKISYQQALASYDSNTTETRASTLSTAASVLSDLATILPNVDSALHDLSVIPDHTFQQNQAAYSAVLGDANGTTRSAAAGTAYEDAITAYKSALAASSGVSSSSSDTDIANLITKVQAAAAKASDAATRTHEVMILVNDRLTRDGTAIPATFTTLLATINTNTSTASSDASSALSAKTSFDTAVATLSGGDNVPLTVQSAQLTYTKAQNTYNDARDALSDYVVTAPFAGTIAAVTVQVHDQTSGSVATLITTGNYAELSLSESDAAQVKVGNKAKLTFDAIDGLTLNGTVSEVGSVGTVSSGVVSYTVKVTFDTQDSRVKPGMTVTADITANTATGLMVPSSAVKTSNGKSYVLAFKPPLDVATSSMSTVTSTESPTKVIVTTGLVGDTHTIILSGLAKGEQIVTKTTVVSSSSSASSSSSSSAPKTTTSSTRELRGITSGGRGGAGGPPGM